MNDSDTLFILVVVAFAIWVAYSVGKNVGASRQRKAQELYQQAQDETDPERKAQLLLEWNALSNDDNPRLQKSFKAAVLKKPKK